MAAGDDMDAGAGVCQGDRGGHPGDSHADDDDVTVEEVECLAACGGAPALQVNYEYHELMTPETAAGVVDDYKAGRRAARTISGAKR